MKRGETYTSGWLKAADMLEQGQANGLDLTIKAIKSATMDDGKQQRSISFQEDERELGLNVTNWDTIADLTGKDDDDHWIGTVINAYPHKLDRQFNGATHGIRIRHPQGVGPAHTNPRQPARQPNGMPPRAPGSNGAATVTPATARVAAWEALKASVMPDATDDMKKASWLSAIATACPGKAQPQMTVADWQAVKAHLEGYSGEPDAAPIADSDIPF